LLLAVTLLLIIGAVSIFVAGRSVVNGMLLTRDSGLDNKTWVFAQLEVDFLRFESALHDASETTPITSEHWREVQRSFDIYYSRVETLVSQSRLFDANDPNSDRITAALGEVGQHRDLLAKKIDKIGVLAGSDIAALLRLSEEITDTLREVAVGALMQITRQHEITKANEEQFIKRFLLLAIVQILVLATISFLAVRLIEKLRERALELEKTGNNFRNIVEASLDGAIELTSDGRILSYNSAAATIFGIQDQSVVGQLIDERILFGAKQRFYKSDPAIFLNDAIKYVSERGRVRIRLKTCQGIEFFGEVTLVKHTDWQARPMIIAFIRDVSHNISDERKMKQARDEALRAITAKDRFLNLMSHEMRTPLHGVIASLDMIRDEECSVEAVENLQIARDSAAAALAEVEDVLAISDRGLGITDNLPLQPFDVADVVKLVVSQARLKARGKDLHVSFRIKNADRDTVILGRREAFRRAVTNLVDNAVKFTPEGTVRVTLRFNADHKGTRRLTVIVMDTGPGIAFEKQALMFEDFKTIAEGIALSEVGNGLGLGIARRAVERMGGTLVLDSHVGIGSRFSFDINAPRTSEDAPLITPKQAGVEHPSVTITSHSSWVLVVDDHKANRSILEKMMTIMGYRVVCASNGYEAVNLAAKRRFSLILIDIQMPGIDGLEATRRIRSSGASNETTIFGITANLSMHDSESFHAAGMQDLLGKPITIAELHAKIEVFEQDQSSAQQVDSSGNLSDSPSMEVSVASGNLSLLFDSMSAEDFQKWLDQCFLEIDTALTSVDNLNDNSIRAVHQAAGTAAFLGIPMLHEELCRLENAMRENETVLIVDACERAKKLRKIIRIRPF